MSLGVQEADLPQPKLSESELQEPIWSVVSFDNVERSGLKYSEAVLVLSGLEAGNKAGLCIVTDKAAARLKTQE